MSSAVITYTLDGAWEIGCSRRMAVLTVSSSMNENTPGARVDSLGGSGAAKVEGGQTSTHNPRPQPVIPARMEGARRDESDITPWINRRILTRLLPGPAGA